VRETGQQVKDSTNERGDARRRLSFSYLSFAFPFRWISHITIAIYDGEWRKDEKREREREDEERERRLTHHPFVFPSTLRIYTVVRHSAYTPQKIETVGFCAQLAKTEREREREVEVERTACLLVIPPLSSSLKH
jgi:hypothetical protein